MIFLEYRYAIYSIYPYSMYYMDPDGCIRYISIIGSFAKKTPAIDSVSLSILKHFAWERSLSAYQLDVKLKSTDLEMAYKNVNKRVHSLVSLNLIRETEADGNNINKHKAKYYSLTEFGIYQLFLNKLNGLQIRELDTIKFGKPPSSNTLIFFQNYHSSLLFESFLYPYFEKNTLFAIGDYLLLDLYNYLADCCHRIRQKLKYYNYRIPAYNTIFYWNRIQGQDKNQEYNKELLLHLKEQFSLDSIDSCEIEKRGNNGDTITVKTSTGPIILKYDQDREKVRASSTVGGKFKEIEYSTFKLGSDIQVGMRLPDEKLLEDMVSDVKQIQQIIYEFVYDLSLSVSDPEKDREFLFFRKILSQDKKFMATIEEIYKNRHGGFEKGYQMLTANAT
jgi:hypothetical protein